MKIVENKIMYDIYSGETLKVGQKIEFGKKFNGMYQRVFEDDRKYMGEDTREVLSSYAKGKRELEKPQIREIAGIIHDFDFSMRELGLEIARKEHFSDYPSRFTCLFVVPTKKECEEWAPRLIWRRKNCQLVKLKLNGKLFCGDSHSNEKACDSLNFYINQGKDYWAGKLSEAPQLEYLFEGTAEVVDIIKVYTEEEGKKYFK